MTRPVLSPVRSVRRTPVEATRLAWCGEDDLRAAIAHEVYERSPRGRQETLRALALDLSRTLGELLRGDASEADVLAAENDVLRAIAERRGGL